MAGQFLEQGSIGFVHQLPPVALLDNGFRGAAEQALNIAADPIDAVAELGVGVSGKDHIVGDRGNDSESFLVDAQLVFTAVALAEQLGQVQAHGVDRAEQFADLIFARAFDGLFQVAVHQPPGSVLQPGQWLEDAFFDQKIDKQKRQQQLCQQRDTQDHGLIAQAFDDLVRRDAQCQRTDRVAIENHINGLAVQRPIKQVFARRFSDQLTKLVEHLDAGDFRVAQRAFGQLVGRTIVGGPDRQADTAREHVQVFLHAFVDVRIDFFFKTKAELIDRQQQGRQEDAKPGSQKQGATKRVRDHGVSLRRALTGVCTALGPGLPSSRLRML